MHRLEFDARNEEQEASTNPWIDVEHIPVDFDTLESPPPPHSSPVSKPAIGHRRSQTSPGHPLRPSLSVSYNIDDASGFGTSLDLHETRPSLRRAIKARTESFEDDAETALECKSHKDAEDTRAKETEIIVHYVCSLHYGLAVLAADLYPHKKRKQTLDKRYHPPPRMDVRKGHTISSGAPKIRRVPVSELSFFPPPSAPLSLSALPSPSRPVVSRSFSKQALPSPPSAFSRNASPLGLANIWNGAREEIPEFELDVVSGVKRGGKNGAKVRTSSFGSALGGDAIPLEETLRSPRVIRTQQLQPSAAMIIPVSPKVGRVANVAVSPRVHPHTPTKMPMEAGKRRSTIFKRQSLVKTSEKSPSSQEAEVELLINLDNNSSAVSDETNPRQQPLHNRPHLKARAIIIIAGIKANAEIQAARQAQQERNFGLELELNTIVKRLDARRSSLASAHTSTSIEVNTRRFTRHFPNRDVKVTLFLDTLLKGNRREEARKARVEGKRDTKAWASGSDESDISILRRGSVEMIECMLGEAS
ncbi:hypothetical protein BU17DRAFT_95157 [Hysterangium stoloniferum]|nr:hypothetical protein BU17DRAFT_95157 [Hysterangium stoloniferum]